MSFIWTLIKTAIFLTLFALFAGILAVGGAYFYFVHDLPKLSTIEDYQPPSVSEVFDRNGQKVGEFWKERRVLIPYEDIPQRIIQAIISSEDDRFFQHSGIDYFGIFRAMVETYYYGSPQAITPFGKMVFNAFQLVP